MEINERFIKFSSRVPFSRDIALGEDIIVNAGGENYIYNCVKTEDLDQQDGTVNRIYTLKALIE